MMKMQTEIIGILIDSEHCMIILALGKRNARTEDYYDKAY